MCVSNSSCPAEEFCDKSLMSFPHSQKGFSCQVTKFDLAKVGAITIFLEFGNSSLPAGQDHSFSPSMSESVYRTQHIWRKPGNGLSQNLGDTPNGLGQNGTGILEVYKEKTGGPLYFNCTVDACDESLSPDLSSLSITCANVQCHATCKPISLEHIYRSCLENLQRSLLTQIQLFFPIYRNCQPSFLL